MKNIDIMKADLISQIDKRLEDKIIEPTNADLLKKLIMNAETSNEAMMIAELGTTYKRTGFHFDKRLERLGSDIKYLKKNECLSFETDKEKLHHKLIIGDNYDALQQLLITHRGMIDVIYIDPPYGCNDMGEFAKTNYTNSITRDNLLSMLYPRLILAKELLSDEGVIFCSVDDKNQAYIKCLFDEIFREFNFISCMTCHSNPGGNKSDFIENTLSYVLVYSNNRNNMKDLGIFEDIDEKKFRFKDEYGLYRKGSQLEKWGNDDTTHTHPNLAYSIYYNPLTSECKCLFDYNQQEINDDRSKNIVYQKPNKDLIEKGYFCIRPRKTNTGDSGRWRIEPTTFLERLEKNSFIFEKQNTTYKIYEKERFNGLKFKKAKNFIPSEISKQNSAELINIFGNKPFDYPKPTTLLKYLIGLYQNRNCYVLDFFAGSGTTGQAVLELNREDGGKRQFILCTNNEITDMNPNGIAYDVTSKRLKRVMTGECYNGSSDFPWIKSNKAYGDNLDVYEIESVYNAEQGEGKTPFDVIDETCYDMPKFESVQEKIMWVCNNFENTQKYIEEEN